METTRRLPQTFLDILERKDPALVRQLLELREFILSKYPDVNELLYHTHALTSVFTVSEKMSDGFCLLPIYTSHFNLGFQKGVLLNDATSILAGTGKLMRHIPITSVGDFKNPDVEALLDEAYKLALEDAGKATALSGETISKIRT